MRRLLAAVLLLYAVPALAEERIASFSSHIVIRADSSMEVAETLRVMCEQRQIKHGIYRDFPTTYKDSYGNTVKVGFSIVSITRDGHSEPYHTQGVSNGQRVYIGDKNSFMSAGPHSYVITYDTSRQLGYFDTFDELYWNVTGNGWVFPIDHAEAIVEPPPGAAFTQQTAYTGSADSTAKNYQIRQDAQHRLIFTADGLQRYEGLTISVDWPKGFVHEPTEAEKQMLWLQDNKQTLFGFCALLLIVLYYVTVWFLYGRSPKPGTIIPLFSPPQGFSPASMYCLRHKGMGKGNTAFGAALVNMAVKKCVRLDKVDDSYTAVKISDDVSALSDDEMALARLLFADRDKVALEPYNAPLIGVALKGFTAHIKKFFGQDYFITNSKHTVPGVIMSVLAIAGMFAFMGSGVTSAAPQALFMGVWLTFWSFGVTMLTVLVVAAWMQVRKHKLAVFPAVFLSLFALPFWSGEIFGLCMLVQATSVPFVIIFVCLIGINGVFHFLMKALTPKGRAALDKIEGFRMFLSVTEKDRLQKLNPPEMTPELFEQCLPYAIALGVENQWGQRFASSIPAGQYAPGWYTGVNFATIGNAAFMSSLSDGLSSAIASSSVVPGSSGGGGGSSGGGGGGGGGGGW